MTADELFAQWTSAHKAGDYAEADRLRGVLEDAGFFVIVERDGNYRLSAYRLEAPSVKCSVCLGRYIPQNRQEARLGQCRPCRGLA